MITYKRLITDKSFALAEVCKLYENSFPINERRNFEGQTHILKLNNYHCESIHKNEQFIGLIFWWDFETLRYIEHLAIIPQLQNKGLGSKIMKNFIEEDKSKLTLLEVEPAVTDIQNRRIEFYRKLGFKINDYVYTQPALQKTTNPIVLKLLSFPLKLSAKTYKEFITTYHSQIYSHLNTI